MVRVKAEAVAGVTCVRDLEFSLRLSDSVFVWVKLTNHDPAGAILLSQPKPSFKRERKQKGVGVGTKE